MNELIYNIKWKWFDIHYPITSRISKFFNSIIDKLYFKHHYAPYYEWVLKRSDYTILYGIIYDELQVKLGNQEKHDEKLTTEEQLGDLLDKVEFGMKNL